MRVLLKNRLKGHVRLLPVAVLCWNFTLRSATKSEASVVLLCRKLDIFGIGLYAFAQDMNQ
jgi:hypothetical protein